MTSDQVPFLIGVVLSLMFIIWSFVVIRDMAARRGHSPWPWWIIALCGSPFGAMLLLWLFFDVTETDELEDEEETQ